MAASAIVSSLATVFARMVPSARRARVAQASAGWLLRLGGAPVKVVTAPRTGTTGPAVFVANRAGSLDALILAGVFPQQFLLADPGEVKFMPRQAAALLQHLTLDSAADAGQPVGWRLRDSIRQALEAGHSVLVLSDSAPGAPAVRSRYRLDAFHAAALTGSPLVPVGMRGTAQVLGSRIVSARRDARVAVGKPIDTSRCDQRELVDLRDRVRAEIAELCR